MAKNLFLWPDRSYLRKASEAGLAILIELFWTKERILEIYLNIAEFGQGIYGVKTASQVYFRCPPSDLSHRQAALLAATLPNPKRYHPDQPGKYLRKRATWILGQMDNLGKNFLNNL